MNKEDSHLDLFIQTVMESDCVKNSFFIQYGGKKVFHNVAFPIDKLAKYSKEYQYMAVTSFLVYSEAASGKVAYKVRKGDKVTFDKMYFSKSGKVYFRIMNNKESIGWIASDQENLFAELPSWG